MQKHCRKKKVEKVLKTPPVLCPCWLSHPVVYLDISFYFHACKRWWAGGEGNSEYMGECILKKALRATYKNQVCGSGGIDIVITCLCYKTFPMFFK